MISTNLGGLVGYVTCYVTQVNFLFLQYMRKWRQDGLETQMIDRKKKYGLDFTGKNYSLSFKKREIITRVKPQIASCG